MKFVIVVITLMLLISCDSKKDSTAPHAFITRARNCESLKRQIDAGEKSGVTKSDNVLLKDHTGEELELVKREVNMAEPRVSPCYFKNTDYRYKITMMGQTLDAINCSTLNEKTKKNMSATILFSLQEGNDKKTKQKKLIPRAINVGIYNGQFTVNGQNCTNVPLDSALKY
jgi:hypothetical protein